MLCQLGLSSQERIFNNVGSSHPTSSYSIVFSLLSPPPHSGMQRPILQVDSSADLSTGETNNSDSVCGVAKQLTVIDTKPESLRGSGPLTVST